MPERQGQGLGGAGLHPPPTDSRTPLLLISFPSGKRPPLACSPHPTLPAFALSPPSTASFQQEYCSLPPPSTARSPCLQLASGSIIPQKHLDSASATSLR